jgi:acyl-CoA synthetase (AMP-forming)/AMP-acid ligase II
LLRRRRPFQRLQVRARCSTSLEWHVAQHPDRAHVTVLEDETTVIGSMTYAQLADAARKVAAALIARDVVAGRSNCPDAAHEPRFLRKLLGILYAGAIPVPIYPPARLSQLEEHMYRQAGILRNAGSAHSRHGPAGASPGHRSCAARCRA